MPLYSLYSDTWTFVKHANEVTRLMPCRKARSAPPYKKTAHTSLSPLCYLPHPLNSSAQGAAGSSSSHLTWTSQNPIIASWVRTEFQELKRRAASECTSFSCKIQQVIFSRSKNRLHTSYISIHDTLKLHVNQNSVSSFLLLKKPHTPAGVVL